MLKFERGQYCRKKERKKERKKVTDIQVNVYRRVLEVRCRA